MNPKTELFRPPVKCLTKKPVLSKIVRFSYRVFQSNMEMNHQKLVLGKFNPVFLLEHEKTWSYLDRRCFILEQRDRAHFRTDVLHVKMRSFE